MIRTEQDTPPPATESTSVIRRGHHETYDDYFKRVLLYDKPGRHEIPVEVDRTTHINLYGELGVDKTGHFKGSITPTHNKLVAAYAPTNPEGIAQMEADIETALGPVKIIPNDFGKSHVEIAERLALPYGNIQPDDNFVNLTVANEAVVTGGEPPVCPGHECLHCHEQWEGHIE